MSWARVRNLPLAASAFAGLAAPHGYRGRPCAEERMSAAQRGCDKLAITNS
jgi:hypothetical protein